MQPNIFEGIYQGISIPVIVCDDNREMTVLFANAEAYLLLNPSLAVERLGAGPSSRVPLNQVMRFNNAGDLGAIRQELKNTGSLKRFPTTLLSAENTLIPITLSANMACHENQKFAILYLSYEGEADRQDNESKDVLNSVLSTAYYATSINRAVNSILSSLGNHICADRVYVFEDLFNNYTRNTYEWCAPNVESAIQDLQNLCKDDYNYDVIVNPSGMYIAGDVSMLPAKDRDVLEPQGIKAIAIMPLFYQNAPIGYIGCDDCKSTRKWSLEDLTLLKGVSSIVSSLIIRRNAETSISNSQKALQAVSDNVDTPIFVSDVKTYQIKFVNRALEATFGVESGQLIDKLCWQVLQKDMTGPCPFCPIPRMLSLNGEQPSTSEWEHRNTVTGAYFLNKGSLIEWTDGNLAYFETSLDITPRKEYEEQLHHYASTDIMTGVFNREWGSKLLRKEYESARISGDSMSLCFIDLDGLKNINDTYGHNMGDEAILTFCNVVRKNIRKSDIVCRWGGDEFIVLLKCGLISANAAICKIQSDLEAPDSEEHPKLAFSYGIIDFTAAGTLDDAISLADGLMYENKRFKRKYQ